VKKYKLKKMVPIHLLEKHLPEITFDRKTLLAMGGPWEPASSLNRNVVLDF